LRQAEAPIFIGGAAGKRYCIIKGILEGAAGIRAEEGSVIKCPVAAPLEEDAGIELIDNSFGLLAGGGLEAVAVRETIKQVGLEGERTITEQRRDG
jgi:hypothetical protein